ncbi:MAG: hypothetical protein CMM93_09095 [Rickettsiales bacterium]|nr:hypothetical protein [Rickettsiales bacterium]|tara:strand:+ start:632 stop:853 length:222 start_codon:yes stop_codon:yes gene_type:complete
MNGRREQNWQRSQESAAADLDQLALELRDGGTLTGILVVYLEDGVLQKPVLEAKDEENRRKLEAVLYPVRRFK